jgi:hypothetical protein
MPFAQKSWLAHFGIPGISDDVIQGSVEFDFSLSVRSREEWLRLWLELEPDDSELASMTSEEVWAIWHTRLSLRGFDGPLDQLTERWGAIKASNILRQKFEAGDQLALFRMIYRCAKTGMRIPEWAATAFIDGHDAVVEFREKGSWDEAFGKPLPKGAHREAEARRIRAYHAMLDIFRKQTLEDVEPLADRNRSEWGKIPGVAVDDAFFDQLGEQIGVSRTVAKEIYYKHKKYTIEMNETFERIFRENAENSGNTEE